MPKHTQTLMFNFFVERGYLEQAIQNIKEREREHD